MRLSQSRGEVTGALATRVGASPGSDAVPSLTVRRKGDSCLLRESHNHLAIFLLLCPNTARVQVEPGGSVSIGERILSPISGEQIGNKSVFCMLGDSAHISRDWSQRYSAASDPMGGIAIPDAALDRYRFRALCDGFVVLAYGGGASRSLGIEVALERCQQLKNLSLGLITHSTSAGHVLDTDGEPTRNV